MNKYIEHTGLKHDSDIVKLCEEANDYKFRAVCVHPDRVKAARDMLLKDIKVVAVVGFPFGQNRTTTKIHEAAIAQVDGADEVDVVLNIRNLKSCRYLAVVEELSAIVDAVNIPVKVIVEECFFNSIQLEAAYRIVEDSGAFCIKTSTGMLGGATPGTVQLWKSLGDLKIKAAGGIRTYRDAKFFINAGADFIGTSNGVEICKAFYS